MRSDFKSATQIYVNPIYFELQLILRNDLFLHENRWNWKKCPKFFHRVILRSEFKSAAQIYINPIYFELQLILRNDLFLHENRWNWKKCPKFFHRVIFAFWFQICNPNLCKSHIFWITANIEKWSFFAWKSVKSEKLPEILS